MKHAAWTIGLSEVGMGQIGPPLLMLVMPGQARLALQPLSGRHGVGAREGMRMRGRSGGR